ncbi:MAG TPA: hypothetical protein VFA86_01995 [Gammaproteobacteria bacterium]|nr:hypothetical protein [Gammaproteobacteria bacterium]
MPSRPKLARAGLVLATLLLAGCATPSGPPRQNAGSPPTITIRNIRGLVQWPGEASYYSDGSAFSIVARAPARGELVLAANGEVLQRQRAAQRSGGSLTFRVHPASSPDTADGQTMQYALVLLEGQPPRPVTRTPVPVTFVRRPPAIERLSAPARVPKGSLFTVNWRARGKQVRLLSGGAGSGGGERQLFQKTAGGFAADLRGAKLLQAEHPLTLVLRVTGAAGRTVRRQIRVGVSSGQSDSGSGGS